MTQKQYTDRCVAVQADADSDRETGAADRNSPEKQCVEAVPDYQTTRLPHYHITTLPDYLIYTVSHLYNITVIQSHQDHYLRNSIPRCTLLCLVEITCLYVCYDNYFLISSTWYLISIYNHVLNVVYGSVEYTVLYMVALCE